MQLAAVHAKRITIKPEDMHIVRRLRGPKLGMASYAGCV